MANTPSKFKQIDVTRAIRGAIEAGLRVAGAEIARDGTIRIMTADATAETSDKISEAINNR